MQQNDVIDSGTMSGGIENLQEHKKKYGKRSVRWNASAFFHLNQSKPQRKTAGIRNRNNENSFINRIQVDKEHLSQANFLSNLELESRSLTVECTYDDLSCPKRKANVLDSSFQYSTNQSKSDTIPLKRIRPTVLNSNNSVELNAQGYMLVSRKCISPGYIMEQWTDGSVNYTPAPTGLPLGNCTEAQIALYKLRNDQAENSVAPPPSSSKFLPPLTKFVQQQRKILIRNPDGTEKYISVPLVVPLEPQPQVQIIRNPNGKIMVREQSKQPEIPVLKVTRPTVLNSKGQMKPPTPQTTEVKQLCRPSPRQTSLPSTSTSQSSVESSPMLVRHQTVQLDVMDPSPGTSSISDSASPSPSVKQLTQRTIIKPDGTTILVIPVPKTKQTVKIIKNVNGKIMVRGLKPGQQLIQTSDGLHLIDANALDHNLRLSVGSIQTIVSTTPAVFETVACLTPDPVVTSNQKSHLSNSENPRANIGQTGGRKSQSPREQGKVLKAGVVQQEKSITID